MHQPPSVLTPGDGRAPRVRTFRALRHRDFRLFWTGLLLSMTGGWMQQLAGPWLVYRLVRDRPDAALILSLVGFVSILPAMPLSLLAGPLIDRFPRRPLLIACQLGLFLPPIGVATLIWTGQVQVWHIIVAELLRGAVLAIDQPAKQAAIVEMTGKEDVGSALGLWSSATSLTRVLGPILGGVIVTWAGEGLCYFLNGITYLAVVAALLAIRLPAAESSARRSSLAGSLVDGVRYMLRERLILALASLVVVAGLLVQPFQTPNLLPAFATAILGADALRLGVLTASAGAGATLGGLGAASLPARWQRRFAVASSLALPLAAVAFAFSHSFVLSCGLLLAVGALIMALEIAVNALILTGVRDEFRGRVVSVFMAAVMGAPRLGGLQTGWLVGRLGASWALAVGAGISLVYSLVMSWIFLTRRR
jgi:MFS family permease